MAGHNLSAASVTITGLFHDLVLKRSHVSVVWGKRSLLFPNLHSKNRHAKRKRPPTEAASADSNYIFFGALGALGDFFRAQAPPWHFPVDP